MDNQDSKGPPIIAKSIKENDKFYWDLHSDGSVMIYESTGEFIEIVYLADEECNFMMIKIGLTNEIIEEIQLRWGNYLSWQDERNEENFKAEQGIYSDKGQDMRPGELTESEWLDKQ